MIKMANKLFHIDGIKAIYQSALYAGISLIMVGPPGCGKTELLRHAVKWPNTYYIDDITAWGLLNDLKKSVKRGKRFKRIIIGDLNTPFSRGASMSQLITTLNAITEDGLRRVTTFNTKLRFDPPLKIPVYAAMTRKIFEEHIKSMYSYGFSSRVMWVSYSYSDEVKRDIANKLDADRGSETDEFPYHEGNATSDPIMNKKVGDLTGLDIRQRKMMHKFAKGLAVLRGKEEVDDSIFEETKFLYTWMNNQSCKEVKFVSPQTKLEV